MTDFTAFDRTSAKALRTLLQAELDALGEKHGISIKLGNAKYSPGAEVTFTNLTIRSAGEVPLKLTPEGKAFTMLADTYGMHPDDLGREFTHPASGVMKIVGLNTKAPKNPIMLEGADGKRCKTPADSIKPFLKRA